MKIQNIKLLHLSTQECLRRVQRLTRPHKRKALYRSPWQHRRYDFSARKMSKNKKGKQQNN